MLYVCTIKYILMLLKEELTVAFLSILPSPAPPTLSRPSPPPHPPSSLHMYSNLWNILLPGVKRGFFKSKQKTDVG